jgi:3'-phosphoadenosine 5'-phosphosulfate sulfotransferase (PAPS reductase)/FAD synthetase
MMDAVVTMAREQGVTDRLVAVHCDLGRAEWEGTGALAAEHAAHYGISFEIISRPQGDLVEQIMQRRRALDKKGTPQAPAWPSMKSRYCTSDQKTSQVKKVHTRLADETRAAGGPKCARILDVLGLRAEESKDRAKKPVLEFSKAKSSGNKEVWTWNPILAWVEADVWARIKVAGTRHHFAYDLGMRRLSCVFCVFGSKDDLLIAGRTNRDLLDTYVALEDAGCGTFQAKRSLHSILDELKAEDAAKAA